MGNLRQTVLKRLFDTAREESKPVPQTETPSFLNVPGPGYKVYSMNEWNNVSQGLPPSQPEQVEEFAPEGSSSFLSGLGGILGTILQPTAAEAMPMGRFIKDISKVALGSISSASRRLEGTKIGEKLVKGVFQGKGDTRVIVFSDGTGQEVTKDYIHSLSRKVGTEGYLKSFETKAPEEQLDQARRSLKMHQERHEWFRSKGSIKEKRERQLGQLKELGTDHPEVVGVWVGKKYFTMPKKYAEVLERLGEVRIDRSKKGSFE